MHYTHSICSEPFAQSTRSGHWIKQCQWTIGYKCMRENGKIKWKPTKQCCICWDINQFHSVQCTWNEKPVCNWTNHKSDAMPFIRNMHARHRLHDCDSQWAHLLKERWCEWAISVSRPATRREGEARRKQWRQRVDVEHVVRLFLLITFDVYLLQSLHNRSNGVHRNGKIKAHSKDKLLILFSPPVPSMAAGKDKFKVARITIHTQFSR